MRSPNKTTALSRARQSPMADRLERQFARDARRAHRVGVPQFLARLVGLERAQYLCRDTPIFTHHD